MKKITGTVVQILLAVFLTLTMAACASGRGRDGTQAAGGGTKADMSDYATYDAAADYVYVTSSVQDMYDRLHRNETFAVFFGFSKCPWCRDFMPVLNEAAKRTGHSKVYYVNTRGNPNWKSNLDIDNYDLLVQMAFDYLPYDEAGIKHLDAPTAYFVKGGKVQDAVFAPEYDAINETIPADVREALLQRLMQALKAL